MGALTDIIRNRPGALPSASGAASLSVPGTPSMAAWLRGLTLPPTPTSIINGLGFGGGGSVVVPSGIDTSGEAFAGTAPFAVPGGIGGGGGGSGWGNTLSPLMRLFGGPRGTNGAWSGLLGGGTYQSGGMTLPWDFGAPGSPSDTGHALGGFSGLISSFKKMDLGGFTRGVPVGTATAGPNGEPAEGGISGVSGLAGAALSTGGMLLATRGLLGTSRGTWGGVAEGTLGGAMIGFEAGGPLGAAIGAAVGAGIGLGEKLFGVESPEKEAERLIKQIYGVRIDDALGRQIAQLAQQKYGGHISIAVRDPEVRKMVLLYSQATGQKMPMSAATPQSASLAEMAGKLYQQAVYVNGTPNTFQSNLPVLGGYATGNYPAPTSLTLNVGGQSAADLLEGRVARTVTPSYIQDGYSDALSASDGRLQNSAMMQQPGLLIS